MSFIREFDYNGNHDLGRIYVIVSILYTSVVMYMVMNFVCNIL